MASNSRLQENNQLALQSQNNEKLSNLDFENKKDDPDDSSPQVNPTEEFKQETSRPAEAQNNQMATDPISLLEQKISSLLTYDKATQHYICTICKVEARNKSNITEHVELHIEGFLFSCNTCSQTFPNRPTLRRHKYKCKM